jgi:hypothetical protein
MAVRSGPRELLSAAVRKRGLSPPLSAQNDYGFTHDVLASTHLRRTVRLRENRFDTSCGVAPARPSLAVRSGPRELLSAAVRKRGLSPPLSAQNDYGLTHDVLASTHLRRTVRLRENRFDTS